MSTKRWLGLGSIKIGVVTLTSEGLVMPATFNTIENIVPDTARFVIEEPDETDIFVEDNLDPDITVPSGASKKYFEFATRDMNLQGTFVQAFGGSTSGSVYSFPTAGRTIRNKAVQVTTDDVDADKFIINAPNCALMAGADLSMKQINPDTGWVSFRLTIQKAYTAFGTVQPPFTITRS